MKHPMIAFARLGRLRRLSWNIRLKHVSNDQNLWMALGPVT